MSVISKQDGTYTRTASDLERKYQFGKTFAEMLGLINEQRDHVDSVESSLSSRIDEQYTKIMRDTEQVLVEALTRYVETSDLEEYEQTVNSALQLMSDRITANVESITEINTDLGEKSEKLLEHEEMLESIDLDLGEVKELAVANEAALSVMPDQITAKVSEDYVAKTDMDTYMGSVSTEIEQTAYGLNLSITENRNNIADVDGDVKLINEDLSKHFIFDENGLTIKVGNSEMKVRIDNDSIAFYNGEIDESDLTKNRLGWWDGENSVFYTGDLVVNVNERAQFGNFAFVPRSNGSLSFLKVR